jgi:hypothetical protein
MRKTAIASGLLAGLSMSPGLLSGQRGELDGCYIPVGGSAESASYSESEQLGQYRVVLVRKDSHRQRTPDRVLRRVVIEGPFRGELVSVEASVLSHVLGTDPRDGFLYTQGDSFQIEGMTSCVGGGEVVLEGTETLNPIAGTGRFAGIVPGGSILVRGTVNTCTGLNDFDVVPGEGELCFEAE